MKQEVPVSLTAGGKEANGQATAEIWSDVEKQKRALRGWALMWILAVVSVFLPLAHFVLVPFFLVAGPFAYFKLKKQPGKILGISANCPFCGKELSAPEMGMNWPLRITCGSCSEWVTVNSQSEAQA